MKVSGINMKATIFVILFLVAAWNCYAQTNSHKAINADRIGNVLHCLQSKLGDLDYLPPHIDANRYRVRYFYGIQHPWTDENNELHLLVYGEGEKSATLYEAYFESRERKPVITLGLTGKFIRKNGQLVPNEILFGIGTYDHIQNASSCAGSKASDCNPGGLRSTRKSSLRCTMNSYVH